MKSARNLGLDRFTSLAHPIEDFQSPAAEIMTPATNRTSVLNPLERFSEIVFGLIMVLSFTGALSVAEVGEDIRIMLLGAIGCKWGIIDAAPSALGFLASLGVSSHILPTNIYVAIQ